MEGKNEKVEEIENARVPKAVEIVSREIPEASKQPIKTTEEEFIEEEIPEESDEEYPEGEYDEEYPEGSEGYEDDDWEGEVGGSTTTPLGGLYGLFKYTLKKPDSKRVSNLTNEELGSWNLSLRDCERIALIAETFHHPGVAKFFIKQSRIISDTAMSRKGWLTELFITSKKFASRESGSTISNLPQLSKKSKWRVFSNKENQQTQEIIQ